MEPLGRAAARVVQRLAEPTDPDRIVEKTICDFLRARNIDLIDAHGAVWLAAQFWGRTRSGGRVITSQHVSITDLSEAIITELQIGRGVPR